MADPGWQALRDRLAGELATLADHEFVVVNEKPPPPGPKQGLLRRRPAAPAVRHVQFLRDEDVVYAECVGATLFGGPYDIAPADHERLRTLGWRAPGDTSETYWGAPNYRIHATPTDAERLADLAVDSLEVLGLTPTSDLELRRDR